MRCDFYLEGVSARLDSETLPPGLDDEELDRHLASCPGCRAWADRAQVLHTQVRVRSAVSLPDRTDVLVAGVPVTARPRPFHEWARYALVILGLSQLVLALPSLLGDGSGSVHMAREMGAIDLAMAVGLLSVAWRPRLAGGLLPFAVALVGATAITAVVDMIAGHAFVINEAHHVLDLAGVVVLLALPVRRRPARAALPRLQSA